MLNVTPMASTKEIAMEYIQKEMGKKLNISIQKIQKKTVMEEMRDKHYKAYGKQIAKWQKYW